MVECVEQNVTDLVLMGITPTYPSTKYGYVVPAAQVLDDKFQVLGSLKVSNLQRSLP